MKDGFGNELAVGDAVHIKVGNEWIDGIVLKIQNGGLAVTGIPKNPRDQVGVTPDAVVLQVSVAVVDGPPGNPHFSLRKLVGPQDVANKIIESETRM